MAYSLAGFYPDQRAAGHRIHTYTSTDAQSVVEASGYFDSLSDVLLAGDEIACEDSTNSVNYSLIVDAISAAGVVTTRRVAEVLPGTISGVGATRTILPEESGKTFLFDRAAGIVYTLPAPKVGLKYRFVTTVLLTSNAYTINTDAATTFLVGAVQGAIEGAATDETHMANGSTHVGISSNATTTGGLIGGWLELECISTTQWAIKGVVVCTATPATPFTT